MKHITLLASFLFPFLLLAQMPFRKCLRKIELTTDEVIYSNEEVSFYPRVLIYDIYQPDSVSYLGCFGTDQVSFLAHFEGNGPLIRKEMGGQIVHTAGPYADTILINPISQQLGRFRYADAANKKVELKNSPAQVILYYWSSETLDRHLLKNYRFFRNYLAKHPSLNASLLPICTDQLE